MRGYTIMKMGKTGTHKTGTHKHTNAPTQIFIFPRVGIVIGRIYDNDDGENWHILTHTHFFCHV